MKQFFICVVIALTPAGAFAQQWVLDSWQVAGGVRTYDGVRWDSWNFTNRAPANANVSSPLSNAVLAISGSFGANLRWNSPGQEPPTFIHVQLSSSALVWGRVGVLYQGTPILFTDSGQRGTTERGSHGQYEYQESSQGRGYQRLDSTSGLVSLAPVQIRAGGSGGNYFESQLNLTWRVLPQLQVNSPRFEPNFGLLSRERLGERIQHQRDRDGTLVLDVALRPSESPATGWEYDGGYYTMGANPSASMVTGPDQLTWRDYFHEPRYEWSASGLGGITQITMYGLTMNYEDRAAFHYSASDLSPNANRADRETTFVAKLSDRLDQNAPEIEARYKIRWHFPIEGWEQNHPDTLVKTEMGYEVVEGDGYAIHGGEWPGTTVWCRVYHNSPYLMTLQPVSRAMAWGKEFVKHPVWKILLATCSFAAQVAYENSSERFGVPFQLMWNHPDSTFDPPIRNDSRLSYYRAVPIYYQYWATSFRKGEKYGDRGFEGMESVAVQYWDGREGFRGYVWDIEWGSGPGGNQGNG